MGFHLSTRRDVQVEELESTPAWKLPEPSPLRAKGPLVQMEAVSFAYPFPQPPSGTCATRLRSALCRNECAASQARLTAAGRMQAAPTSRGQAARPRKR